MSLVHDLIIVGATAEIDRLMAEVRGKKEPAPWEAVPLGLKLHLMTRISQIAVEAASACECIIREQDRAPEVEL